MTFRERNSQEVRGLAIIWISQQKAELLHVSTLDLSDFQKALSLVADYTKNNSVIIDLVVKLAHYDLPEEGGKSKKAMDPFFKPLLQEAGFKWLTIENLRSGERCTIYKHIGAKQQ